MKKFISAILLTAAVNIATAQDTLRLKNGTAAGGKIISMQDGKIILQMDKETKAYTVDEVQGIDFAPAKIPCDDSNNTYKKITAEAENDNKTKTGEGIVLFSCKQCMIDRKDFTGTITIKGTSKNSKTASIYNFSSDANSKAFCYKQNLAAGEYTWQYSDNRNNSYNGTCIIKAGEELSIFLYKK
jgi:hypothetical protein